ncbi:M56 family metallopeptidase [Streptomyces sp. NPDC050315]|uniref:M56 family metallopeptidase n=1 Tax=Streptomyces sp. NPDC050315 TaxID=3155039 RepID=UPI003425380C
MLLIVLFLASSTHMMSNLLRPLTDPKDMADGCALAAGYDPQANSLWNQMLTGTPAFEHCLDANAGGSLTLALPYLATAALMVLAMGLYALLPYWKERSGRVVPVASMDADGALRAELARLLGVAGLRRTPRFVVDPTAYGPNAIVYGRLGRYTVRLDAGLVMLFRKDRRAFEATLLHEFAHIRNGDVDITYLTVAIWRVFVVGALAPYAVVASGYLVSTLSERAPGYWSASLPLLVRTLVMSAFLVALTYLAMADVLRTREMCADIEAVGNQADRSYWTRHITDTPRSGSQSWSRLRAMARAVRAALRTHPDWSARAAATVDPAAVFTLSAMPMFLTGVAVTIFGYHLNFTPGANEQLVDYGTWPAATLATAVAGVAVWRRVTRSVGEGAPPSSVLRAGLRAGLWVGAGCLGGDVLVSQSLGDRWLPPWPQGLLLAAVVLVPAAVLWWTGACAVLWADMRPGRRRVAAVFTLAVSGAALAWWFAWWQAAGRTFAGGLPLSTEEILAGLYGDMPPSTTMDVVATLALPVLSMSSFGWSVWLTSALWIVPLAGLARRRRASGVRGMSAGTVIGLLGGVVAAVGLIVVTHRAHESIWDDKQPVLQAVTLSTAWFFAILLCTAAGASFAVSCTGRGNAATAMAAAGTAMAVALVVLFAVTQTDGCVPPLATVKETCAPVADDDWFVLSLFLPQLLAMAGLATLVAALLGALITAPLHRRERGIACHHTGHDTRRRPGRRAARLAGTTVACAVLVGASAAGYFGYFHQTESDDASASDGIDRTLTGLFKGPVSTEVRDAQVWAWSYFGGGDLLAHYAEDIGDLDRSANTDGRIDVRAMRAACVNLRRLPDRAAAYFPIPDPRQQAVWSAALANTRKAAQKCVTGLDRMDQRTLAAAFRELHPVPDPVTCVADQVDRVVARAQQERGIRPESVTVDRRPESCP